MRKHLWASILFAGLLCAGGCAAPDRLHAVPASLTGSLDFAHVARSRFSLDDTAALTEEIRWALSTRPNTERNIDLLALSGGQEDGAFGAGLLTGWSEHGNRPKFTIVTGTSTGALTAPFAFLGTDYDGALEAMYTKTNIKDIISKRYLVAAITDDAMMDSSPLYRTISRYLTEDVLNRIAFEYRTGRLLLISTTNLDSGKLVIWNVGAIAASDNPRRLDLTRKIILASAAVPGLFPPVMLDAKLKDGTHQEMHVDGGTVSQVFLYPPQLDMRQIIDAVRPQSKTTAYIIRNGLVSPPPAEVPRQTLEIAQRAIETMISSTAVGDLYRIYSTTKRDDIGFKLAIMGEDFTEPYTTRFDLRYMRELYRYGHMKGAMGYPWQPSPPGFN
ncbi:patatin-like phospholipase family protein [Hyphomicrobium sp. NDB2Meth4]|uniref:patatin-like phospholipase family protein n=1 Tax=Hyphomicrobium sp. NDB2Meth4 TaxID=1892846 RepID=UPI000AC7703F|nr:patatin-like phospholipase family protein [Hyphomicrobium sp. NDB2Meth4]